MAEVREWLQPTDYLAESGEFRRHLLSQAPGTGLWLCKTDEYRKWHDSPDHGSLWIKGVPGAGKSVMAASIIQHLRTTEDCPVLFFFFRNIVAANFSPRALFQDWLAQLLPHSPKLQFALKTRLSSSLAETSDNDLIHLFIDGVSCVPRLYCVGDALDEMRTDNRAFLDQLNKLATYRPRSLKLLITSRPKQHLQSALRDSSIVHVSLQQKLVDADIISFLAHRFDTAPQTKVQQHVKQDMIDMVARRSQGLFLYAKLTIDQIEAALLSEKSVEITSLEKSLPSGLEETYNSVLAKQRERGVTIELQVFILEAIIHASRPLRLNELSSLLKCIHPDAAASNAFKALVSVACGPLVEILEDETLQVIHHSFTEYLRGDTRSKNDSNGSSNEFPIINSEMAHKRMAIECLAYLKSGTLLLDGEASDLEEAEMAVTYITPKHQIELTGERNRMLPHPDEKDKDPFEYRKARLQHPFLVYAVENWDYHASRFDVEDEELFQAIKEFFDPRSLSCRRWLVLQGHSTFKGRHTLEGLPNTLHIAAFSGLSRFCLVLISQGLDISALDAQERVPMHWAAANGHAKVVSLLLDHGGRPDPIDARGLQPIHLAAKQNHASVVKLLLNAGVKPDTIKTKETPAGEFQGREVVTKGECAIFYASQGGHTETILEMIPYCKSEMLERLLCECCRFGRADAVSAILERTDVSANATYRQATALYFACRTASAKCVELLIDRGADVGRTSEHVPWPTIRGCDPDPETKTAPLHQLIQAWDNCEDSACKAIFSKLVRAGADLEQVDGFGQTPLMIAVSETRHSGEGLTSPSALKALLMAGADTGKTDEWGNTPLHQALSAGCDVTALLLLLEYGCDPNRQNHQGMASLHMVMEPPDWMEGSEDIPKMVRCLLDHGADPNAKSHYRWPVLLGAMHLGVEIFQLLLPLCTDESVRERCWFTMARFFDDDKFILYLDILLSEGMDINTLQERTGQTLHLLCLGSEEKVEALRIRGANTDLVDNNGNNALHVLIQEGRYRRERVQRYVSEGSDPLVVNNDGYTLLHHVAKWYNDKPQDADYVYWLLSLGIDVNAQDNKGNTALHLFMQKRYTFHSANTSKRVSFVVALNDKKDVNFNLHNNDGLTALHIAVMQDCARVTDLLSAGADISFPTKDSESVLHVACRARQTNIVGQILEHHDKLNVDKENNKGRTPLHIACRSGELETVALLLRKGASVEALDARKRTPLHACAEFSNEQKLWDANQVLHQGGPLNPPRDPLRPIQGELVVSRSRSPWYVIGYGTPKPGIRQSFFHGLGEIVRLLLEHGANAGALDTDDLTALDVALLGHCTEFAEVFAADPECLKVQQRKALMRAHMMLLRRRPYLATLEQSDQSAFDLITESPELYLELLTPEEAANIIIRGYQADPTSRSHYKVLQELTRARHLHLIERTAPLFQHYNSYGSLKNEMVTSKKNNTIVGEALTPLQLACGTRMMNLRMLHVLVEKVKVDVNCQAAVRRDRDPSGPQPGGTALHVLASADHWWQLDGLKYLLAHGAAVNIQDERGRTPLHIASQGTRPKNMMLEGFWRLEATRILLDNGANPNTLDKQGFSALHMAANAPPVLKELLSRGADVAVGSKSPLFQALFAQNLEAAEMILDHGVDVNVVDRVTHMRRLDYKLTDSREIYALLCAAWVTKHRAPVAKSLPLVRTLILRGANLYAPLNDRETMIHFLFGFADYEVLDMLLEQPCVFRIDFNRRDQQGRSILMAACDWRHSANSPSCQEAGAPTIPLRILDAGADPSLLDNDGRSALHHILDNPDTPIEDVLEFTNRQEIAPLWFLKDKKGFSPFHYALCTLRLEVCELLLSKGANFLEPDPDGQTALHHVARQCLNENKHSSIESTVSDISLPATWFDRCLSLWQQHLSAGGSINATDNAGNPPLFIFLNTNVTDGGTSSPWHLEFYDKLFSADSGVDVHATNDVGETALHVITKRSPSLSAPDGHDKAMFKFMMDKGVDPLKEDAKGRTALDVATALEKNDIVGLFSRKG
ncbi:Ankyrin-2 [Paramyrothecium foliicola]|nr:Ankyrin-2 [Paramyrothecium foliicola]